MVDAGALVVVEGAAVVATGAAVVEAGADVVVAGAEVVVAGAVVVVEDPDWLSYSSAVLSSVSSYSSLDVDGLVVAEGAVVVAAGAEVVVAGADVVVAGAEVVAAGAVVVVVELLLLPLLENCSEVVTHEPAVSETVSSMVSPAMDVMATLTEVRSTSVVSYRK